MLFLFNIHLTTANWNYKLCIYCYIVTVRLRMSDPLVYEMSYGQTQIQVHFYKKCYYIYFGTRACVAHLSFCFEETLYRIFHRCFHQISAHFQRRILFRNRQIKNKNYLWWPCLLIENENEQSWWETFHRYFLPSFGSFDQAVSEDKIF